MTQQKTSKEYRVIRHGYEIGHYRDPDVIRAIEGALS